MQARNNTVKEVNSMEESFGSMIATSAKGVAGGQTCKSILMLREIARQFGTLQRANLALKQSLESGASSNKDVGYIVVLLFARKTYAMLQAFNSGEKKASWQPALNAVADTYCVEVFAPHLCELVQKLAAVRAALLAGDREG